MSYQISEKILLTLWISSYYIIICIYFCRKYKYRETKLISNNRLTLANKKLHIKCECPICLEDIELDTCIYDTYCNHNFHKECLYRWKNIKYSCPICNRSLGLDLIV